MRVLMAAPFETKGRFKGGISTIVNEIIGQHELLHEHDLDIIPFETCRINRSDEGTASLSIINIRNALKAYIDLPKEILAASPDILYYHTSIHFALLKDLLILKRAKKKSGIRTIVHIHAADFSHIMTKYPILNRVILNLLAKFADKIVFLSRNTVKDLINHRGVDESKCHIIYNFSTVRFSETETKWKLERPNHKPRLLYVGYISKKKGVHDMVKCLSQRKEDFDLHICGTYSDAGFEDEMQPYLDKMGDKVHFHGYVDGEQKREQYLQADVLILPSYAEGFPMVIAEAFHAGCAVLATSVGAIPEAVSAENGFLFEPGDTEQLNNALDIVLTGSEEILAMQKKNLGIAPLFSIESFIGKLADVCRSAE